MKGLERLRLGLRELFGRNGSDRHHVGQALPSIPVKKDEKEPNIEACFAQIRNTAKELGLDTFDIQHEIVPISIINRFNATGAAGRFFHWTHKLKMIRINNQKQEFVTNSNPSLVFIPEGEHISVAMWRYARALAEADFYKNNGVFAKTDRNVANIFSEHAFRIRQLVNEHGAKEVHEVLDAAMAIQWLIDSSNPEKLPPEQYKKESDQAYWESVQAKPEKTSTYDDLPQIPKLGFEIEKIDAQIADNRRFLEDPATKDQALKFIQDLEAQKRALQNPTKKEEKRIAPFPFREERDVLWFITAFSPVLKDWQKDILSMVWVESLYLYPKRQTEMLLEGWKTFIARNIMRRLVPNGAWEEEYRKVSNGLGIALFDDILNKFDPGSIDLIKRDIHQKDFRGDLIDPKSFVGKTEYNPLFVREVIGSDWEFINSYLTRGVVEDLSIVVEIVAKDDLILQRDFASVRKALLSLVENAGMPLIQIAQNGGDWNGNRELYLEDVWGGELHYEAARKAVEAMVKLWGRRVHLKTKRNNRDEIIISPPYEKTYL